MNLKHIKKIRWLLLLALAALPLFFLPSFFTNLKLEALLRKNSIENCLTFTYGGGRTLKCYNANPDHPESVSYVFLPSFADMEHIGVDTIAERVDFTGGTENGTVTVHAGETAFCSFETGIPYQTYFHNSAGKEIGSQTIIFLKSGKLPTMYVTTETGNMDKLDADKTYKEKGFFEFLDTDGNPVFTGDLRSISGRGNQTFTFEKKSYQINLKIPVDFMGMGTSDTWILLSNVYDPAYIRNRLTYEMALQAGMAGSPKSEYIDVYFNGAYAGMYQLCEKVEIGENRLEIADLEMQNRTLNGEKLDYADTFTLEDGKGKGTVLLRNPPDITGGYLIEHDYGEKYDEVTSGFCTDAGECFALKNPSHASPEEISYIRGLMQEIEDAIQTEDGYHPVTGRHYTEYIDLESWADKYLVEEITRNNGGGSTSSYFYKPQDSISTKVYGGPVWDYDKGYGNAYGYNQNTRDLAFLTLHSVYTNWFYYLYGHEDFVEAVKKEYREKFADYLTEMAEGKADEYLLAISESAVLDRARFSHVYRGFGEDALDYTAQAQKVKQFILERKAFLDEVWLEDAEICIVHFKDENGDGNRSIGVKKGECIREFPSDEWETREFLGWKMEGTEEYLTLQTPITEELTVYAVWKTDAPQ